MTDNTNQFIGDMMHANQLIALTAVAKAAKAHIAALDALQNTPVGEFTGNEVPACDEAEAALRAALEGQR